MKTKQYIIVKNTLLLFAVALGLFVTSCTNEDVLFGSDDSVKSTVAEGERFKITLGLKADDLKQVQLRSGGVENLSDVTSLRVLVFDKDQKFLYSEDATLGSVTQTVPTTDAAYLPDFKREGITDIKQFTVSLVKSSEKRYLHFVANFDWSGFTQDYFAVGKSAGEFMTDPRLTTTLQSFDGNNPTTAFSSMWSMVEVPALDESTFKGKVVKLLRNYAKITIKDNTATKQDATTGSFTLEGYAVGNVLNKGSVAPFRTENYSYYFDFNVQKPTIPVGATVMDASTMSDKHIIPAIQAFNMFEKDNSGDKKTFVILKGIRVDADGDNIGTRYYKVDLVLNKGQKTVNQYIPILRNKHYEININSVNSDGFATIGEAIKAPAGNNVFSSVEMQDFENVSDGKLTLSVSPIQQVIIKPGTYSFDAFYSGGNENLKFYPSWNTTPHPTDPLSYLDGTDSYLGGLTKTETGFTIDVKEVPSDAILEYTVDVAGLRVNNGTVIDTWSGATTPLLRKVRITLRPPYSFNAVLQPMANGQRVLEFDVPKSLPSALYPFEVLIKASEMTPAPGQNLMVVHQEGVMYYQYSVRPGSAGTRVKIPFVMNTDNGLTTKPIALSSEYYNEQTLPAESVPSTTKSFTLNFKKPNSTYTTYSIPSTSLFKFTYNGQSYNSAEDLLAATKISFQRGSAVGGYSLNVTNDYLAANGTKNLTLTTDIIESSDYGYVKYTVSLTRTLSQWMASTPTTHTMTLTNVEIKGRIIRRVYDSYYGYYYDGTLTPSNLRLTGYYPTIALSTAMSVGARQYYSDGRYGYPYTIKLNITTGFPDYLFRYNYLYGGYSYGTTDKTWSNLESSTSIEMYF